MLDWITADMWSTSSPGSRSRFPALTLRWRPAHPPTAATSLAPNARTSLMRQTFAPPLPDALRCTWREHHRGTPAEPLVREWVAGELGGAASDLVLTRDTH